MVARYTPVASYYKLAKTVEDDPEFDVKKAQRKLRRFVEGSEHAIRLKAEIMVDHFHDQVLAQVISGAKGAEDVLHQQYQMQVVGWRGFELRDQVPVEVASLRGFGVDQ